MRTTRRLRDAGFVPFAFGAGSNLDALDLAPFGVPLVRCDAEDPRWLPMHAQLLRLNALAYGGMSMPAWVQLDCGVLPSAFLGWGLPAERVPAALREGLEVRGDEPLVPVAEALAVPSATPGRWVSWSLCSVVAGFDLGFASKLLSLAATRARSATGIVQLDGPALRVHTRFGPLWIEQPVVPYHTKPETTVIYRLDTPDLDALDRGVSPAAPPADRWLDPADLPTRREMDRQSRAGTHTYQILPPGRLPDGRIPIVAHPAAPPGRA